MVLGGAIRWTSLAMTNGWQNKKLPVSLRRIGQNQIKNLVARHRIESHGGKIGGPSCATCVAAKTAGEN